MALKSERWAADNLRRNANEALRRLRMGYGIPCYYINQSATKNLLTNGDIETALSGTVNGFVDTFADLNAWTNLGGTITVTSNVVAMAANSAMQAGHSEWWDWSSGSQLRFQWATGGSMEWFLRYASGTDNASVIADGTNLTLNKKIGGTPTTVAATADVSLTNGTWYWFDVTISGTTCTVKVFTDSPAGTKSATQVGSTVSGTISDSAVATANMVVKSGGAAMHIGGAFSNVCRVVIPAPPGWTTVAAAGVPAFCVSKTTKFSGNYSLSIYSNNNGCSGQWLQTANVATATHMLSGRVKTALSQGQARVSVPTGTNYGNNVTGTSDWTVSAVTAALTSPTAAVGLRSDVTVGTAWFDNLWLAQEAFDTGNTPGTYVGDHNSGETCVSVLSRKAGSSGIRKLDVMAEITARDVIAKLAEGRGTALIDTSHATGESCVDVIRRLG